MFIIISVLFNSFSFPKISSIAGHRSHNDNVLLRSGCVPGFCTEASFGAGGVFENRSTFFFSNRFTHQMYIRFMISLRPAFTRNKLVESDFVLFSIRQCELFSSDDARCFKNSRFRSR